MQSLTQFAKEHAGNWETWESFYSGVEELRGDGWTIVYRTGRDSDLLGESNAAEIAKRLQPFLDADPDSHMIRSYSASHWACGWMEGYLIKVYNTPTRANPYVWDSETNAPVYYVEGMEFGGTTPAFDEWYEIQCELEDYPALNEEDWSEREYNACWEAYEWEIKHLDLVDSAGQEVTLTVEQVSAVYNACEFDYTNNYPDSDQIHDMIIQLYEYYDRDSWESSQE